MLIQKDMCSPMFLRDLPEEKEKSVKGQWLVCLFVLLFFLLPEETGNL